MKPDEVFKPVSEADSQVYLGRGIHTLGLISWLLPQNGVSDVFVTTFSTSVEFLSGFFNLRKTGLIRHAVMVADLKASRKTAKLMPLVEKCFDEVYLAENHSKVVLLHGADALSVISSQNNTYGGRIECTYLCRSGRIHQDLLAGVRKMIDKSLKIK